MMQVLSSLTSKNKFRLAQFAQLPLMQQSAASAYKNK